MRNALCESCELERPECRRTPTVYGVRVLCRACRDGYRGGLRAALREIEKGRRGAADSRRPGDLLGRG